jgi:hypothetical protein
VWKVPSDAISNTVPKPRPPTEVVPNRLPRGSTISPRGCAPSAPPVNTWSRLSVPSGVILNTAPQSGEQSARSHGAVVP